MAYATVEDLERRWKLLDPGERERAAVLLDDAAVMLAALVAVDGSNKSQAAALRVVSCSMVRRAMNADAAGVPGVIQQTISADVYSHTQQFQNPTGDMYLTKKEEKLLGIGKQGARFVQAACNDLGGAPWAP